MSGTNLANSRQESLQNQEERPVLEEEGLIKARQALIAVMHKKELTNSIEEKGLISLLQEKERERLKEILMPRKQRIQESQSLHESVSRYILFHEMVYGHADLEEIYPEEVAKKYLHEIDDMLETSRRLIALEGLFD